MLTTNDFVLITSRDGRKGVQEWGTTHRYYVGDRAPRGMIFDCDARSAALARESWLEAARKACREFYGVA